MSKLIGNLKLKSRETHIFTLYSNSRLSSLFFSQYQTYTKYSLISRVEGFYFIFLLKWVTLQN